MNKMEKQHDQPKKFPWYFTVHSVHNSGSFHFRQFFVFVFTPFLIVYAYMYSVLSISSGILGMLGTVVLLFNLTLLCWCEKDATGGENDQFSLTLPTGNPRQCHTDLPSVKSGKYFCGTLHKSNLNPHKSITTLVFIVKYD